MAKIRWLSGYVQGYAGRLMVEEIQPIWVDIARNTLPVNIRNQVWHQSNSDRVTLTELL